jgi:hypothetical protein
MLTRDRLLKMMSMAEFAAKEEHEISEQGAVRLRDELENYESLPEDEQDQIDALTVLAIIKAYKDSRPVADVVLFKQPNQTEPSLN